MSAEEKVSLLKQVFGRGYKTGAEYLFHCPACDHHKKKLSFNIEKDKFKCWTCDFRGNSIRRAVRKYGNYKQLKDWEELAGQIEHDLNSFEEQMREKLVPKKEPEIEQIVALPDEFRTLTSKNLPITARPALRFLYDRGITKSDILLWKIGYCGTGEYEARVVIPSFGTTGNANYFVGRTYNGSWMKYLSPPVPKDIIFNELYLDFDDDITIVEGVFDAIVAGNAIPILGSSISDKSRVFQKIVEYETPIFLALDADAEKKALFLTKQLLEYGVQLYKIDIKPFSDVGEMTKDEFRERKQRAELIDSEAYLSRSIGLIK